MRIKAADDRGATRVMPPGPRNPRRLRNRLGSRFRCMKHRLLGCRGRRVGGGQAQIGVAGGRRHHRDRGGQNELTHLKSPWLGAGTNASSSAVSTSLLSVRCSPGDSPARLQMRQPWRDPDSIARRAGVEASTFRKDYAEQGVTWPRERTSEFPSDVPNIGHSVDPTEHRRHPAQCQRAQDRQADQHDCEHRDSGEKLHGLRSHRRYLRILVLRSRRSHDFSIADATQRALFPGEHRRCMAVAELLAGEWGDQITLSSRPPHHDKIDPTRGLKPLLGILCGAIAGWPSSRFNMAPCRKRSARRA
jgi:hypothetical protein